MSENADGFASHICGHRGLQAATRLSPASSPPKQASKTQIPDAGRRRSRRVADKKHHFFRHLSENIPTRVRVGRSNAEDPAKNSKKTEACGDQPYSRPASQTQSETLGRQPARFS